MELLDSTEVVASTAPVIPQQLSLDAAKESPTLRPLAELAEKYPKQAAISDALRLTLKCLDGARESALAQQEIMIGAEAYMQALVAANRYMSNEPLDPIPEAS